VGPFDIEVVEGLRSLVLHCRSPDELVELELEWTAAIEAFEEPPLFVRTLGRVMDQGTRLIQTGHYSGFLRVEDRRYEVRPETWWGARDRSWGVRSMGLEREPPGIQQAHKVSAMRPPLWIWSPMQFPGYTVHFNIAEHADGRREIDTVRRMSALGSGGDVEELGEAWHELRFDPDTRELLPGSLVGFCDADGRERTVTLHPLRHAYLRAGTGYGGPDPWRHGKYMGEQWCSSVKYDVEDPEVTARIGPAHVVSRMELDGGDVGYGTFETQVFGAFPRYGFTS